MSAMRILSVCLSVRPTVKRVIRDKTKESCARIFIPHEKPFTLILCQEEWLVRGDPSTGSVGAKSPILNRYSLVAPQP